MSKLHGWSSHFFDSLPMNNWQSEIFSLFYVANGVRNGNWMERILCRCYQWPYHYYLVTIAIIKLHDYLLVTNCVMCCWILNFATDPKVYLLNLFHSQLKFMWHTVSGGVWMEVFHNVHGMYYMHSKYSKRTPFQHEKFKF